MDGLDAYGTMVQEFWPACCWLDGASDALGGKPCWWNAPWLIHRAHIVSSPRVCDRRAVVLLCPVCHGLHHNERYRMLPEAARPTLENLLWLKQQWDPEWFDLEWLQRHSVRRLPEPEMPIGYNVQLLARRKGISSGR